MHLPFSQAAENNKTPILAVLSQIFSDRKKVLEIGSGTGQHAVHFAHAMPQLTWQPSDLPENHAAINAWREATPADNLLAPITFDLASSNWPGAFDAVYSANTAHIVSWPLAEKMLQLIGENLPTGGLFALYGPFNIGGNYTSDSNREFDHSLQSRDPASGIRDQEISGHRAKPPGLKLEQDNPLPANNRLLIFKKY